MTCTRSVTALMIGWAGLLWASPVQAAEEPTPRTDPRPLTLPYRPGQPIPPGYQMASRPYLASVIAGGSILGLSYVTSAIVGLSFVEAAPSIESYHQVPYEPRWLYVPVIGPWIALATAKTHDCRNSHYTSSYYYGQCESANGDLGDWRAFLVLDGISQTVGAALVVLGSTRRWHQLVLTDDLQAQLVPVRMGRTGEGLALVGSFRGL